MYAGIAFIGLIIFYRILPETKGKTLERSGRIIHELSCSSNNPNDEVELVANYLSVTFYPISTHEQHFNNLVHSSLFIFGFRKD